MLVEIKEKQMREVEVLTDRYTLCDKCNEKIIIDYYDAFECKFLHKTGDCYPEGGAGDEQKMDLCQKCAGDLIALLIQQGYRINESEWDY